MLLAIDTSTVQSGVACYAAGELLGECGWNSGRNHTTQVLTQIDLLLHYTGHRQSDIEAVAVALGPGSWSGLRVGLSIAKGIALAAAVPLLGIGTLDAIAYQHQHPLLPVYPLITLGRGRFATARFQMAAEWMRISDYESMTLHDLLPRLASDDSVVFCGDVSADLRETVLDVMGDRARLSTPATLLRRSGYLAELAWHRYERGEHDTIATLEPIYLGEAVRPPLARSQS